MTESEFKAGHDGMHVPLTCENHPGLRWSCKKIAVSFDANGVGRYNGSRHIFYSSRDVEECSCPAKDLRLILDGKEEG